MNNDPEFYININNDDQKPAPQLVNHELHGVVESSKKEYMKFFAIIFGLFLAATLTSSLTGLNWEEWMRWFMGGFFIVFGGFKLIGYENFVIAFRDYDILAKRHKIYAYIYPFIELFLGVIYVLNLFSPARDVFTVIIMSIGAFGVAKAIMHRSHIQCACLGNIIRLPLTTVSLVENLVMASMAFIMLLARVLL